MCGNTDNNSYGRKVSLREAVGTVLAHDLTEIRAEEFKGPAFRKGHVVSETDLPHLERLGKRHLYILDIPEGMMHEDEAALILADSLAGEGVTYNNNPSEGKITLTAGRRGLLRVDVTALTEFNMIEGVMCAGRHNNTVVEKGDAVAGTRAIPLVIPHATVQEASDAARSAGGIFRLLEFSDLLTGLIVTGNEVYSGLIEDKFVNTVLPKLEYFGCPVLRTAFAPDDPDFIAAQITSMIDDGAKLIITTGGMSVDPDDVTRIGVEKAGAGEMLYGSAVLPGAMLLIAYIGDVPVIGVPACGMFHDVTIFDLVLPRILAGDKLTRRDLAELGHGGFCLNCKVCRYPVCPFGKQ